MSARVRSKICGITSLEDALCAVEAGADALGFVFYEKSPRYIEPEAAASIVAKLPAFICATGLFVNHSRSEVEGILDRCPLSLLQFHGDELEDDCLGFGRPYIKAIRVRSAEDVPSAEQSFPSASALLVDTYREGVPGGTGERFDWTLLPSQRSLPLILAGGLNAENVRSAIRTVHPYAVDVSGGVEQEKGRKDHHKVNRFLAEVSSER